MTRRDWLPSTLALLAVAGGAPRAGRAAPGDAGRYVDVWVRGDGAAQDGEPPRLRARRVDLDRFAAREVERYDAQYDRLARFGGVPLRDLLRDADVDGAVDLAILHFANGMAIPLAFRDRTTMARLDPFVARTYRASRKEPPARAFPPIGAKGEPRPVQFSGNKLVVADRWHPEITLATEAVFSPWTRADTLVGVELVSGERYYAQLDVDADPSVRRGLALFRSNCQFCHGVHHVGASFGWDFVDAPSIYAVQDSAADLYHHVAYRPRNATELGLLMPALASFTEEDAGCLRRWLQAVETRPMPAYATPTRGRARRR